MDRISVETYPKYYEMNSDGTFCLPQYEVHPILHCREEILQKYKQNKVLVITGETGSGKSTQVPQYILDDRWGFVLSQIEYLIKRQF